MKYLPLLLVLFIACQETDKPFLKQEKNQVWSVKEVDGEHTKDQVTFLETYEYDEAGNEIGHLLYSPTGELSGKELAVFDDEYEQPIGTRYYTPEDSLLSYYSLKYDDNGQKTSRWGFDATNDELLRMENFKYDKKGNMIQKDILSADNQLQSSFIFTYDAYGNKTSLNIKDPKGETLLTETYKITKFDDQKRWVENWGWRDDKPYSFRVRELVYEEK
ncbi:hypothetical protein [Portibacter lacus]|uniref:YD repeat-containing protein n=1 Tax=Portibacter lacus TaxID=1099794 RepID=A0AA37WGJ7_9BACT|nr:hypothetical protein [Portibacter lacus]GLR20067.1 hypothetical protein GCM10007940_46830 [Portibacter lacus]